MLVEGRRIKIGTSALLSSPESSWPPTQGIKIHVWLGEKQWWRDGCRIHAVLFRKGLQLKTLPSKRFWVFFLPVCNSLHCQFLTEKGRTWRWTSWGYTLDSFHIRSGTLTHHLVYKEILDPVGLSWLLSEPIYECLVQSEYLTCDDWWFPVPHILLSCVWAEFNWVMPSPLGSLS